MISYRAGRRHVLVVLLASVLAGAGCSTPERLDTTTAEADGRRREQLRDRLRADLGDRYDAPLPAGTAEEIQRGFRLYETLCRGCHGPTGNGKGKSARLLTIQPTDLTDPTVAAFFSDQAKLAIVADGSPGTPMIGWRRLLDEEDRIAVQQFMDTLIQESQSP